jgi:ADP-heptose:LPS heptosyltransferase
MPDAAVKSIQAEMLAPLGAVPGVRLYSLQLGASAAGLPVEDLTRAIADFADTAALIACLDLVVTVDTAVAHLAGALARPVWTLLRYAPDWRWYPDAAHSRWYPTMRLYRQRSPGDWAGVVEAVARELPAATRGATSST